MTERRIRILFADHTPVVGGSQLVLVEHVRALDKSRYEVHVACTNDVPALVSAFREAGATVHRIDMPRLRGLTVVGAARVPSVVRKLRNLIDTQSIQLVVTNTARTSYYACAALAGRKIPLIWWVRDFAYSRFLFRVLRRYATRIIFVSEAVRRYYGDDGTGLVWPVASPIHRQIGALGHDEVRRLRESFGFRDENLVVGFMGRLVAEKGPEDVVEAVARLREEFPSLRLLIVGTGKGQPGDVENRLRQLVLDRGLTDVVRLAGHTDRQASFYASFDAFVIATRDHEAYPTSAVQAMMAGKPVIASDVGGIPEIVRHGESGILYPAGDVEALTTALRSLFTDAHAAARLAAKGRAQVLTANDEDALARRAEALYSSLAVNHRPGV